jgi:transcriptional antiterminator
VVVDPRKVNQNLMIHAAVEAERNTKNVVVNNPQRGIHQQKQHPFSLNILFYYLQAILPLAHSYLHLSKYCL